MISLKDVEQFIKSDNSFNFAEESLESFILPELLQNVPYLLDIFPFEPGDISYKGSYNHTSYKVPGGFNYDAFIKTDPVEITINNACFKGVAGIHDLNVKELVQSSYGKNVGSLDVMLLKFMGWHQKHYPIFLKTTKFVGIVLLKNWSVKEAASESYFTATFQQTSVRKLKQYTFSGQEGAKKPFIPPGGGGHI